MDDEKKYAKAFDAPEVIGDYIIRNKLPYKTSADLVVVLDQMYLDRYVFAFAEDLLALVIENAVEYVDRKDLYIQTVVDRIDTREDDSRPAHEVIATCSLLMHSGLSESSSTKYPVG
jgi:hypothetical protein